MLKRNSPSIKLQRQGVSSHSDIVGTSTSSLESTAFAKTPTCDGVLSVAKRRLTEGPAGDSKRKIPRNLTFSPPFLAKKEPIRSTEPEIADLMKQIGTQQEKLRSLQATLAQEAEVPEITAKINSWRSACQQVAEDLLVTMPDPKPSMAEFLKTLGVNPTLIQYNPDEESFY